MSQLSVMLQESVQREETRTILGLLRGKMDGVDARRTRWSTLRERLGLKGIGCCGGPNSGFRPTNITVRDDDEEEEEEQQQQQPIEINVVTNLDPNEFCLSPNPDLDPAPVTSGMNLAAALAAERQFRATSNEAEGSANVASSPGTPVRVSLMRLLKETDGGDQAAGGEQQEEKQREEGNDSVCCVCMGRKKGAAFIPCGHTFCRVCSRELWLNRGSCPLCNRTILEILDIF